MPPIDPAHLRPGQLLQLVNASPLGTVLRRPRLRRQMDDAGRRFGDGTTINLLRYVRWLATEHDREGAGAAEYLEAKRHIAERSRAATRAAQDIAPIPDVQDLKRRRASCRRLRTFCETYFAETFHRAWSKDHLQVLTKLDRAITGRGLFAFAMPRGSGKTSMARVAALWAVLAGHRAFVCLIAGTEKRGEDLLTPIRMHIMENELLGADFPEAIYPLKCLENSSKRQLQQHCNGRLTHVLWARDRLVFPTLAPEAMPASLRVPVRKRKGATAGAQSPRGSSGAIIGVASLDANLRGPQHTRPDGSVIRPSLVLLDDPQTRRSARSPTQTKLRLQLLNGDVLGMAGPGVAISGMLTCTKIYENDLACQILDTEQCPEWQGECMQMLYGMPTDTKLWEQYGELWADGLRRGKGITAATEFYRDHRAAMDAGSRAAWPDRFDPVVEISPIQHAMNLKLRDEEAFFAEYQNQPSAEQVPDEVLRPEQVTRKCNGRPRATVPAACTSVTAFIDLHDRLLYWCVCAWEPDFTGYVIDYGTWPEQSQRWFTLRNARHTLKRAYPGRGEDGAIQAGLATLVADLLARDWQRGAKGAGAMRIGRLLVDMGYKPGIVANVKHLIPGDTMGLSRGVGITAGRRPMSAYQRRPGEIHGHNWYTPNVRTTHEFAHVAIDVNYWKSFTHGSLATAAGEPANMTLWGKAEKEHEHFAEHVAGSEYWTETEGQGRTVHEWRMRPAASDNHWFDCLVGCTAAASMLGITAAGMEARPRSARKRYTQADLAGVGRL